MRQFRIFKAIKVAVWVTTATVVFGFVVRQLWNVLMPTIFGLHAITFWQALGLFLLCKILFGGFHRGGMHRGGQGGRWKDDMKQRWAGMSAEERERFRAGLRERGRWCRPHRAETTSQATSESIFPEGVVQRHESHGRFPPMKTPPHVALGIPILRENALRRL